MLIGRLVVTGKDRALEPPAKRSLGQHWLRDTSTLEAMVEAAKVSPGDTVLEIGPGLGTLTEKLVRRATQVVAVELDETLGSQLADRVPAANLRVVAGDILRFDLRSLPDGYKVVANIPYYLTSNLLRTLCESERHFSEAAILVQKEVAERVAAEPGACSLLSISVQFYAEVELGEVVPASLFAPPPKVDSQILRLHYREQPLFPDVDRKLFFAVVKAGFSQRRKTLLNALSAGLHLGKPEIQTLLARAGITPAARAQTLKLDQWFKLYRAIEAHT